ncbi:RagB/SusD family nutrient uptake outer membrane protein [uncultured Polaribacter sp.]|uniref:RagB/SusD family nutrient uptake outer membrane protein n=1 Tax=uncultured Polaribacter sp. TaxID=174711 RepID=UPI0026027EC2|nr:RagB/SusD family nutrient uptake outer membrane protein [uncultured Polaribacter sp.]
MRKIKNIFKISVLSIGMLFMNSCEDQLEILPNSNVIADVAFTSVDDLQLALNGLYLTHNTAPIEFNSIFSDNARIGIDNGGQDLQLLNFLLNPSDGIVGNMWTSRYLMVNRASRIIEASEIIEFDASERARVNDILGQAYALRALGHFELFQYFTPDYNNGDGLSVPAVDFVVTTENLPRNTVDEVMTLIDADLATSSSLLDNSRTDNIFITQDFITALRARKALFTGEYATALTEANKLIAKYPLANQLQYEDMWFDADETEVIFKFARVQGNAGVGFIWHFGGGGPTIEMSKELFDILDANQDDIRYISLLNDERLSEDVYLIGKYPRLPGLEFLRDIKIFRVSEMHLIKAEAEVRANNFAAAAGTLKMIRDARFGQATVAPNITDVNSGLDFIFEERRLELAYEGHRWLDHKRLGRNIERIADDCNNLDNACVLPSSSERFTFPIPVVEINANENMVQNPGY